MAEENNNENKNQVIEEGKRTAKKAIMKKVAPILIKILLPFILILLAGALLLGVFNAVGDAVQKVIDGIVDFFTIDSDGAIVISDEQVDMIINSITDLGVSIDGLKLMGDVDYSDPDVQKANQEALRKYIREFYEAQAMTQTLNTNPSWIEENILNGGKPYGTVYIHRTNGEDVVEPTNTKQLTYIPYEEMVKKQGGTVASSGTTGTSTSSLDNFLFIGDSRYSSVASQISALGKDIKNAGVGSSRIDEWVKVVENGGTGPVQGKSVDIRGNYSGISVQLGANSVYNRVNTATTEMKTFLQKLKELYPNTPIFVNSCMQVSTKATSAGYSWSPAKMRDYIEEFNNNIKEYCDQTSNLQYVDISENLEDSDGYIKSAYTGDGLHCNAEGGKVFASNIQKAITGGKSTTTGTTAQSKPDKDITNYFSINEKGELVIAGWTNVVVKKDGKVISNETTINLKNINYKNVISQYTTPMNFFLYLTIITQNPEFVSAVTDLVKMSDIRLTILDTKSTSVNIETYTYTQNTKTRTKVESTSYDAWDTEKQYPHTSYTYEDSTSSETITEVTETTTTSVIPTIKVTYAKTWFCEQTITYNKKQENSSNTSTITGNDSSELQNEDEPELTGEGSVSWKTNQSKKYDNTSDITKYEEGTRGDVIDRTGEKGSQGIKDKNGNGKVDGNEIVDENTTFIGLLDDKFKIPNSTRYDSAGGNLVSGAEMFFYLLQKDQSCQNLEMIMRYILYKYTGRDYGVTELDFNIFDAKDFNSISMSGNKLLKEYIHYWENAGGPPTNADGTKYIIEDDGAGHPTVGYGVDIFNGGFAPLFQQAGYPTYIGGEVDKEFVDALEEQEIQSNIDSIKSATAGLDLKEYQIHALVSRAYNCGVSGAISVTRGSPALNFVDSYQRYWNEETDDQFEEQNNNANFGHSLYTQYMSKPVTSDGKYLAGLERRRKSEWTLFQTGYYDVLDKWYKEGGDILEMCEIVMNDLLDNNVHYSLTNLVWNNIEASNDFSRYGCCCATYVSVVIYRAGLLDADHINQYNYNYTGTVASGGVSTMLRDAGWQRISEEEAQAGDVCVYDGHTFIYAGGNEIWDQNSGCISSSGRAPVRGTLSQWSYYKNTYNLEIWRAP